jgi:hypothetical protein
LQDDEEVGEVQAPQDLSDDWHDQILHDRVDDFSKCAANDHAKGKVHHIALDRKLSEF